MNLRISEMKIEAREHELSNTRKLQRTIFKRSISIVKFHVLMNFQQVHTKRNDAQTEQIGSLLAKQLRIDQ